MHYQDPLNVTNLTGLIEEYLANGDESIYASDSLGLPNTHFMSLVGKSPDDPALMSLYFRAEAEKTMNFLLFQEAWESLDELGQDYLLSRVLTSLPLSDPLREDSCVHQLKIFLTLRGVELGIDYDGDDEQLIQESVIRKLDLMQSTRLEIREKLLERLGQ